MHVLPTLSVLRIMHWQCCKLAHRQQQQQQQQKATADPVVAPLRLC
jgi:hypothetical protein